MNPKLSIVKIFFSQRLMSLWLIIFSFFIFHLSFLVYSCRDKPTPPDVPPYIHPITLTNEDVSCTDAFVRIKTTKVFESGTLQLKRDGQTILSALCSSLDTLIIDEGLLPKRAYKYKAYRLINNTPIDSSSELLVPTLDTTSHEYFFQIDTLGDGNSSVLNDVAIINDTLAYAVGEIYKRDSLGNWETEMYNMAKWNGKEWKLIKAYFEYQGRPYVTQLYAIFAFSENDIWVGTGGPYHWNGNKWTPYNIFGTFSGRVNKFWGTSSNNLYMVGTNGSIAHFNGSPSADGWRRLESGTDVDLTDVWGSPDGSVVWACGWEDFKPTVLLKIANGKVEKAYEDFDHRGYPRGDTLAGLFVSGMSTGNNLFYILSYTGLYKTSSLVKTWSKRLSFTPNWFPGFPFRIRGNGINDLIIVGEYYMIAHLNGLTFKHYTELSGYGRLWSVDHNMNIVIAVGFTFDPIHSKGIVIIGRR